MIDLWSYCYDFAAAPHVLKLGSDNMPIPPWSTNEYVIASDLVSSSSSHGEFSCLKAWEEESRRVERNGTENYTEKIP
jgi:hypothetical protein